MGKIVKVQKDITGQRFGRLVVLKQIEDHVNSNGVHLANYLCKCDCGNYKEAKAASLRYGDTRSCGCLHKDSAYMQGKNSKKYNEYDLSGECGIGYTFDGHKFLFDKEDYDLIKEYCWWNKDEYISSKKDKRAIVMHRLVMGLYEKGDKKIQVDHINRNPSDNRKNNLRLVTNQENSFNHGLCSNNTSGITGVYWSKGSKKWAAQIVYNGKVISLGTYENKQDAIIARKKAEEKYFGNYKLENIVLNHILNDNGKVYCDNAATTQTDPDVIRAMLPYLFNSYGNPSSVHSMGRETKAAIEEARRSCANTLNCLPQNIYYVSSATEADNWAMLMYHDYLKQTDNSNSAILYSSVEHKAIINSVDSKKDIKIPVGTNGVVDVDFIINTIKNTRDAKYVVCVMGVCNETGVSQPIEILSELCHEYGVPLHVDAVQWIGKKPIDLEKLKGITTLTISGHKIGSVKGSAILYIRNPKTAWVKPLIYGGGQEGGLRAGTENVVGIVGLGVAMKKIGERTYDEWLQLNAHVSEMHKLLQCALSEIPATQFNGDCEYQLPHYLNVSFKGIEGESLVHALDRRGICVSAGSACNSGSLEPSYVLTAIGVGSDYINGTIRISLSENNTLEECEVVAKAIKEEVAKLREVSPTWKGE